MAQLINEAKRFQKLAGLINESQLLNENKDLNSYGKILFGRLQKNGFQPKFVKTSQDFDTSSKQTREKGSKLIVVQYDDMGIPGDGFIMVGGNNDNHDEIGKIIDSIKSELPEGGRHFSNNMWSWQITGPAMNKKPQQESTDIESAVNEALETFRKGK